MLRFGAMLHSNLGNENSDAGHMKCLRGPQVLHPWCNASQQGAKSWSTERHATFALNRDVFSWDGSTMWPDLPRKVSEIRPAVSTMRKRLRRWLGTRWRGDYISHLARAARCVATDFWELLLSLLQLLLWDCINFWEILIVAFGLKELK